MSDVDGAGGVHEPVDPPPRALAWLLAASVALALGTLGFSLRYLNEWRSDRAGRSTLEQQLTLIGVPFFKPAFLEFVERAQQVVPPDARILVEPTAVPGENGALTWDARGQARWYLYLNHFLYPRQVYVRRPELASGTLVDYPRWLEHHFVELLGPDGAALLAREAEALDAHRIDWRLRYPALQRFAIEQVQLERREHGVWRAVELPPLPADSPIRERRPNSPRAVNGPGTPAEEAR